MDESTHVVKAAQKIGLTFFKKEMTSLEVWIESKSVIVVRKRLYVQKVC